MRIAEQLEVAAADALDHLDELDDLIASLLVDLGLSQCQQQADLAGVQEHFPGNEDVDELDEVACRVVEARNVGIQRVVIIEISNELGNKGLRLVRAVANREML